jgi:hypothetical protein
MAEHVLVVPEGIEPPDESEGLEPPDDSDNLWKSCCILVDKRMTVFISQLVIALAVISFSFVQLIRSDECESNQLYVGLLTMIIGIFLPSPRAR